MAATGLTEKTLRGSRAAPEGFLVGTCVRGREEIIKCGFDSRTIVANDQNGILILGKNLGFFHPGSFGGTILQEELSAAFHMGPEGVGGLGHIRGIFYRDDGNLVGLAGVE